MGLSNPFLALASPINKLGLVLALCSSSFCSADQTRATTSPPAITEAPVFLPGYEAKSWSLVRGSIIDSNSTARETTYTIFCGVAPACDLSLEFPFVIVEGPRTLKFHGTYTSTYIANLECDFNGTVDATCSGYTSYASGFDDGIHTGPTEIEWRSTLTGSEVQWGTLTLTDVPTSTDDSLDLSVSGITTPPETTVNIDDATPTSSGHSITRKPWPYLAMLTGMVVAAI